MRGPSLRELEKRGKKEDKIKIEAICPYCGAHSIYEVEMKDGCAKVIEYCDTEDCGEEVAIKVQATYDVDVSKLDF